MPINYWIINFVFMIIERDLKTVTVFFFTEYQFLYETIQPNCLNYGNSVCNRFD